MKIWIRKRSTTITRHGRVNINCLVVLREPEHQTCASQFLNHNWFSDSGLVMMTSWWFHVFFHSENMLCSSRIPSLVMKTTQVWIQKPHNLIPLLDDVQATLTIPHIIPKICRVLCRMYTCGTMIHFEWYDFYMSICPIRLVEHQNPKRSINSSCCSNWNMKHESVFTHVA